VNETTVLVILVLFAVSLGVSVYVYAGYPALLFLLSRLRPRPHRGAPCEPAVSILLPIYNEERILAEKLRNTLALDYPAERLEILVLSDGSTDRSEAVVRGVAGERVRLESLPRVGKLRALSHGASIASGEVLVFTDATAMLQPDALRLLLEAFADPEVGGVCGNKVQVGPDQADSTGRGEGIYWRYDKWQKSLESRLGSIFAADGTFYAIRRHLYPRIDDPAQADDIAISARVVLQGYRLVYEPRAVALEEAPAEGREELSRKIRVTNHSVRALLKLGRGLWGSGFYSFELISHKLLRHLAPFFLILLLVTSLLLARQGPLYLLVAGGQVGFYLLAVCGWWLRHRAIGRLRPFAIPYYFCLVNAAAFLGVLSIAGGLRLRAWNPRGGLLPPGDTRS
jgi:cellulose synthase/poly-beta-1,6-N-acetylglucosamine synthase-like glycosyltransferase